MISGQLDQSNWEVGIRDLGLGFSCKIIHLIKAYHISASDLVCQLTIISQVTILIVYPQDQTTEILTFL